MPSNFLHNVPIRTRIALAILALASAALVAMAVGVYLTFASELRRNFDDTMRTRAASALTLVDASSGILTLRQPLDPGGERANGVAFLRLYTPDGQLAGDAAPAAEPPTGERSLAQRAAASGTDGFATLAESGGERFRVLASPVISAGVVEGVLITGLEIDQVEDPLAILRVVLLIAVPATSFVLAIGAFFIARRALRPVAAITASANRIASGDLRERIAGIRSRDEVGELAGTFNHMIDRVAETVERERRFTADAAHELRTPLAALGTSIDVTLARPRTEAEYAEALVAIRSQAGRLTALMRQLLLLSRVDSATLASGFDEVDLAGFLRAVAESFAAVHPGVLLEHSGLSAPLPVRGDIELLTRAFANVLENAVTHGSPEARISIALTRVASAARVIINDDGPGIPQEIRETVFQRFRRGDAARTRGGSGLGLAIVESIVRAHGGGVRLLAGAGTTIEITLPLGSVSRPG